MVDLFAGMVGGLGLFVVGMWSLTVSLKRLASRRLRRTAQRLAGRPSTALIWGMVAGGVAQSMTVLVFIAVSLLRSGLISTRIAFALTLGANIGVTFLVLVVTFDMKTVVLFALGAAGIAVASEALSKYRAVALALLGVATLIFGLTLLKEAAAPLAGQPWFQDMLEGTGGSPILAFLVAAALTAIAQSSSAVSVFAISLAAAGVLTVDQVIMAVYGSFIGSSVITYILSAGLTGQSRQTAMYLVYLNVAICAITIPLFYAELYLGIPSVKALAMSLDLDLEQQLAVVYFITNSAIVPILFVLLRPTARLFEKLWPASAIDEMSKAQFIFDHASVDIGASVMLAELEQKRVFRMLSLYFEAVREDTDLRQARNACRNVTGEITHFLEDLHRTHTMQGVENRNRLMNRMRLLAWMESASWDMCRALQELKGHDGLEDFRMNICEGVDTVFLSVADAMDADDEMSWTIAARLIGDRGTLMRDMRAHYVGLEPPLLQLELMNVLLITNAVEETFFLMSKVEAEFNPFAHLEEHMPGA